MSVTTSAQLTSEQLAAALNVNAVSWQGAALEDAAEKTIFNPVGPDGKTPVTDDELQAAIKKAAGAFTAPVTMPAPGDLVTQSDGTPALVVSVDQTNGQIDVTPLAAPTTVAASDVTPVTPS